MRWPGKVKPKTESKALAVHTDILATCAEVIGAKLPDDAGEDSVSLLPALGVTKGPVRDGLVVHSVNGSFGVREGKWKLLILRNLKARPWRFNELQRDLDGISQKVLTDSLRQMMEDGLAYRHDYQEAPPRVEYGLTELGQEMLPIIDALADFGNYYQSIVKQS